MTYLPTAMNKLMDVRRIALGGCTPLLPSSKEPKGSSPSLHYLPARTVKTHMCTIYCKHV